MQLDLKNIGTFTLISISWDHFKKFHFQLLVSNDVTDFGILSSPDSICEDEALSAGVIHSPFSLHQMQINQSNNHFQQGLMTLQTYPSVLLSDKVKIN